MHLHTQARRKSTWRVRRAQRTSTSVREALRCDDAPSCPASSCPYRHSRSCCASCVPPMGWAWMHLSSCILAIAPPLPSSDGGRRRPAARGSHGAAACDPHAARCVQQLGVGAGQGPPDGACATHACRLGLTSAADKLFAARRAGIVAAILYGCGCLGGGAPQGRKVAPGSGSRGFVRNPEVLSPTRHAIIPPLICWLEFPQSPPLACRLP